VNNETESELAGMMGYNPFWFWVMSFIILAIIFLATFVILRIKAIMKDNISPNQPMAVGYSGEIDKAFVLVNSGQMSIPEACQRVSLIIKDFMAQKTGIPTNMMTLSELKRSGAPVKMIQSIEYAYPIIFSNKPVQNYDEFMNFMNSSRAILDGWWG
jgi:hypothetical protein